MKKISESQKAKIEKLNQELTPLKEERDKLNLVAKKWADKRNKLHEKISNLRKKAANIKERRDGLNEQVQELKKLRDQVKLSRKEKRDRIAELKEKLRELMEKRPDGNLQHIEKEIEKIDWKIQTTSLPLKEEEELINQVRQLETKLTVQKQIKKVEKEFLELRSKEKNLGTEAKTLHEKLAEIAEQSQKYHEKMLETLNKARELQVEADDAHQKYVEKKQQAKKLHQKCVELQDKIRALEQELKEAADKKQAEKQSEIQKELEERALAKLKRGEKLLWEEFQILAEKGKL